MEKHFRNGREPRICILKTDVSGCSVVYTLLTLESTADFGNPRTPGRLRLSDVRHQVKFFPLKRKVCVCVCGGGGIIKRMSYRILVQYIVTCKRSNTIYRQFMKHCLLAVAEEVCQDYEMPRMGRIYLTYLNCVQSHFIIIIIYSQWMEVMTSETLCSRCYLL